MRRNPWMRVAATVSAMLAVLLLAASWRFAMSRGVFASVEEKTPGVCRTVAGISGVTSIAVDEKSKVAYLTGIQEGGLFSLSLDESGVRAQYFIVMPKDIEARALSLSYGPDGTALLRLLFRPERPAISLFFFKPGNVEERARSMTELGRLTTDVLTDPADLASVDGNRFYLVNRHASRSAFGRWLDDAFLLPRANVLYFDGMKFVTVAERLNSPSGLALSKDGSHLYVAEDYPRTIATFSRNDLMGSLDNPSVLSLPANPQKISVAPDGSLIVAARPKARAGQVYRVTLENGVPQKAELLYSHKGEEVTAAAEVSGHLLVGTPSKLLDCH